MRDVYVILTNDRLIKITIGTHKGGWIQKSDTQLLKSGKRCLKIEAHLLDGNYYHMLEFERNWMSYNTDFDDFDDYK